MTIYSRYPYGILIIGGSGSGKTNALLNLINEQNDIDRIYLYAKDLSEPKHELFIKKRKCVEIKYCNDPQIGWMTFIRILMITTQTEKEKS